jgi:hypothetical protein
VVPLAYGHYSQTVWKGGRLVAKQVPPWPPPRPPNTYQGNKKEAKCVITDEDECLLRGFAIEAELEMTLEEQIQEASIDLIEAWKFITSLGRRHLNKAWRIINKLLKKLEYQERITAELASALTELVELKQIKGTQGKTPEYLERQPKAWERAKQLVETWRKEA